MKTLRATAGRSRLFLLEPAPDKPATEKFNFITGHHFLSQFNKQKQTVQSSPTSGRQIFF